MKENTLQEAVKKTPNLKPKKWKKTLKNSLFLLVFVGVLVLLFNQLKQTEFWNSINSLENLKEFILSFGFFSVFVFFVLQFLQVTFIPLPSVLTTLAGSLIFGPYISFIISFCAIWIGSLLAFFLGKKFGTRLVSHLIGAEKAAKWQSVLSQGQFAFFLMLLFPIFPDDLLCLVSGITNMSYKFFIFSISVARPINLFCICFLGSGYLIPFSGTGIIFWIFIAIFLVFCFVFSIKNQAQINEKITTFSINYQNKHAKKIKTKKHLTKKNKENNHKN